MMKFHERVRSVIGDISAADAARMLGRAPGTVRQWMTGERRWEPEELSRLLDLLDIPAEQRGLILSHESPAEDTDDPASAVIPSQAATGDNGDDPTEEVPQGPLHLDGRHLGQVG